jgi:uncharacterized protein YggU (UPF0235/DUF167 family)
MEPGRRPPLSSSILMKIILQVKVRPHARASVLEAAGDGTWTAQLRSPPVDGRANDELVALVARHFGCGKSAVTIRGGASGRVKWVQVDEG